MKRKNTLESLMKLLLNWKICCFLLFIVGVLGLAFYLIKDANRVTTPEIVSVSTLKKIVDNNELSTFQSIYNGVYTKMNEKNEEIVDYHVSYNARVNAGIKFDEIDIKVDKEKKLIFFTLPAVEITEVEVDITTLDFIFVTESSHTETVTNEAYHSCIEDVESEIATDDAILSLADQNAKNIITAWVKPFIEEFDPEYSIQINSGGKTDE